MATSGLADLKASIRSAMGQAWAGSVARGLGLSGPKALLDVPNSHPLRQLAGREKWDAIVCGGGDPNRVTADSGEALAIVVAALPGLEETASIPRHPLFGYGLNRDPHECAYALLNLASPIIQITVEDWVHAEWFDLLDDKDGQIHSLAVDWQEYCSLDGLFVLIRAVEAAHRAAEVDQADHLANAWRTAAVAFGASIGLHRRQSDAWQWFVDHVLAGPWWPLKLSSLELDAAQAALRVERGATWQDTTGHEAVRRREHDVALRAMARRTRHPPLFMVRPSDARWRWLVMHRARIAAQIERACELWHGREPAGARAPLFMLGSLHNAWPLPGPLAPSFDGECPDWATGPAIALPDLPRARDGIDVRIVDDSHRP